MKAKGSIISGPFGSNIGSRFFVEKGIPVIRGNNLTTDFSKFVDNGFVFVTKEKADELGTWAEEDDMVFTAAGTLGQVAIIPKARKYEKYIISNKQLRARLDKHLIIPLFAFYWLQSKKMIEYINLRNTGSTIPLINLSVLRSLPLPYPSIFEQRVIVEILSVLDSKIELNLQINETLEAIGQAVFKRWFVDFEFPNEEGKPYKSSGGEMASSELGEIPISWSIRKMGNVLELAYGKPLKETTRSLGKIPVYGSNGQVGWHDERLVKGPGIIVGRKGNPGTVVWSNADFFSIDTTFYVVPKGSVESLYYLFYVLKFQNLASLSADSAVPGLNRNIVYMNDVVVPSQSTLSQFDSIMRAIQNKIESNSEQNLVLSEIRDNLLPKLMSGKIRVPVTKERVEAS